MPEDLLLDSHEAIVTPEQLLVAGMTAYASEVLRIDPAVKPSSGHFVFKSFGMDYGGSSQEYVETKAVGENCGIRKWEKPGTATVYQYYEDWDACGFSISWTEGGSFLHENVSYGAGDDDIDRDRTSEDEIRQFKKRMEENAQLPRPTTETVPEPEPLRNQRRIRRLLGGAFLRRTRK